MARKKRKKDAETEELLAPDAFESQGATGAAWLEKNLKYVLVAAAAVLGGVLVAEYLSGSEQRSQSELTADLNEAVDAFNEAVDLRTVLTSTSADEVQGGYAAAQEKLAAFRADYPQSPAATLAGLYEAELLRRMDAPDEAAPLYEAYLAQPPGDAIFAFMAHEGAGYAYEAQGKLDDALRHFEAMAEHGFAKGYALKHQGRVLEAKGDTERAIQAYEALSELGEPLALKTFADERLRALQ